MGVFAHLLFVGVVPVYLGLLSAGRSGWMATALLVVVPVYAGLHLSSNVAGRRIRPVDTGFWLFVYIWMGVAPLAQMITGVAPLALGPVYNEELPKLVGVVLLGCVSYDLSSLRLIRSRGAGGPTLPPADRQLAVGRLRVASLVSLAAAPLYIRFSGGLGNLFASRDAVSAARSVEDGQATASLIISLGTALPFLCLIGWLAVRSDAARRDRSVGAATYGWILLLAILNAVVNNPVSNPRQWVGTMVIAAFFAAPITSLAYRCFIPLMALVLTVAFPYLDYFRRSQTSFQLSDSILLKMAQKDFDAFVQTGNSLILSEVSPMPVARQFLGVLGFFVPRSVWPSKPLDSGVVVGEFIHSANTNLSAPLWSEAILNGGVWMVIPVFFLYGWCVRRLDRAFWLSRVADVGVSVWWLGPAMAAGYQIIILRGSLLQATGRGIFILVVLWLLCPPARVEHEPESSLESMRRSPTDTFVPSTN